MVLKSKLSKRSRASTDLSMSDLTASGAAHTMSLFVRAASILEKRLRILSRSSTERSKLSVKMRFTATKEKRERSTFLVCSSSADGIICTTRLSPSERIRLSIGPTTVVLPAPYTHAHKCNGNKQNHARGA